jgi:ubiquinone/menaquinone biosynthesis C-methylase UbiE
VQSVNFSGANYGRVAHLYDKLEWVLGGVLEKTRNVLLDRLPFAPGNPLVLACGTGKFAAAYLRKFDPPRLTINDIAPEMLAVARQRIAASNWQGELIVKEGEATSLGLSPPYDFVSAQFFLDCFPQRSRIALLHEIRKMMAPGAVLLVSDYARPRSKWLLPIFYMNYGAALLGFWILVSHKPNPPGDIERAILDASFTIIEKQTLLFGLFASWLATAK